MTRCTAGPRRGPRAPIMTSCSDGLREGLFPAAGASTAPDPSASEGQTTAVESRGETARQAQAPPGTPGHHLLPSRSLRHHFRGIIWAAGALSHGRECDSRDRLVFLCLGGQGWAGAISSTLGKPFDCDATPCDAISGHAQWPFLFATGASLSSKCQLTGSK